MVEGAVLAVFVVFLFLRDWRATLISALAIPLSAIPAFWFMDLMGFTLNCMSLLALSLVAGVLVDDAIVEIENIVRHMRMGKSAYQASIDAADEIGLAVVATTMSIVAVFLPVGLMPGISGQFFKSFGFTVVVAVLMSLAVARMITPMIAAYFLSAHGVQPHAEGRMMDRYLGILGWTLDTSKAEAYRAKHPGFLRAVWSLVRDHRFAMVLAGFVAFVIQIVLVRDPADDLPAAARPRLLERRRRHAAGHDPRADRGGHRPRGEHHREGSRRRPRVPAHLRRQRPARDRPQEGPQQDQHRVRAGLDARSWPRSPTRASTSAARAAAARRRRRQPRHHAVSSAATIR